ncbi:MAG: hypothetical protein ACREQ9_26825 [Candidatus Binatia bacterium]
MRVVVADASSLILMAKTSILGTYGAHVSLLIPSQAFAEVASPRLRKVHPDARLIARTVDDGLVQVRSVRSRRKLPLSLGAGEAATVRLFDEAKADLVLSDDGRAIRVCRLLGIPFTTTPRVVVDLVSSKALGRGDGRRALEKLAVLGRYAPEIIAAALAALEEN